MDAPRRDPALRRLRGRAGAGRQPVGGTVTVAPGQSASAAFALPESPWPLGDGFFPLGILVARAGGAARWTREVGAGRPGTNAVR